MAGRAGASICYTVTRDEVANDMEALKETQPLTVAETGLEARLSQARRGRQDPRGSGIQLLPEAVIGRIAAGEAIERPASVVKELIENAIDAGATSVYVEAEAGGRRLLRVTDNGSGIRSGDVALAFKRHATSKMRATEDLQALGTLGFRGEALASIAAVSRTTIVTRHRAEAAGVSLKLRAGLIEHHARVGVAAGTAVLCENLFFNTPARLAFLKSAATEKRHIHWVVARYALAYPGIAFALIQDGRERFRSSGSGDLADVVAKAFGLAAFKSMVALEAAEARGIGRQAIEVAGYVGLPSLSRASRDRIILFVNGRAVQDRSLSHAVTQAYEGLLKAGSFPFAVLLMRVPPGFVDVNVHPAKAEVRFRDSNLAFAALQRAVREALLQSDAAEAASERWSVAGFSDETLAYQKPRGAWWRDESDELFAEDEPLAAPEAAEGLLRPRTLPLLRVVGQAGAAYVIAEGPAGLYLIDQQAAHERLLFQRLLDEAADGGIASAELPQSQSLLLSRADAELLGEVGALLAELQFEIEVFGPNSFVIRRAPTIAGAEPAEIVPRMLQRLRECEKTSENAAAALARAAALRRGQILALEEMQALIAQLERCPAPFDSPSGEKTLIHLSREQLAEEFRRR